MKILFNPTTKMNPAKLELFHEMMKEEFKEMLGKNQLKKNLWK
jgi:hypothetical protein